MKLITVQSKDIVASLMDYGAYYVDPNRIKHPQYKAQYKRLADFCCFSHLPIFCASEGYRGIIDASQISAGANLIELSLDVPDSRCVEMDYYGWTDYLYFSSGEEYDNAFGFNAEQALANIHRYIKRQKSKFPQICIEQIFQRDVKSIRPLSRS